jgi:hypothetical protein
MPDGTASRGPNMTTAAASTSATKWNLVRSVARSGRWKREGLPLRFGGHQNAKSRRPMSNRTASNICVLRLPTLRLEPVAWQRVSRPNGLIELWEAPASSRAY